MSGAETSFFTSQKLKHIISAIVSGQMVASLLLRYEKVLGVRITLPIRF